MASRKGDGLVGRKEGGRKEGRWDGMAGKEVGGWEVGREMGWKVGRKEVGR